jgi:hypothetical protein
MNFIEEGCKLERERSLFYSESGFSFFFAATAPLFG